MIRRLDLRGSLTDVAALLPRAELDVEHAEDTVRPIIEDVAARGAHAVLDWGERLDRVRAVSQRRGRMLAVQTHLKDEEAQQTCTLRTGRPGEIEGSDWAGS